MTYDPGPIGVEPVGPSGCWADKLVLFFLACAEAFLLASLVGILSA